MRGKIYALILDLALAAVVIWYISILKPEWLQYFTIKAQWFRWYAWRLRLPKYLQEAYKVRGS